MLDLNDSVFIPPILRFHFASARGASRGDAYLQNGDQVGKIAAISAKSCAGASGMKITASENHSAAAQGMDLTFSTVLNTTNTASPRMTILNNGYVGIGTAAPSGKLDVAGKVFINNPSSAVYSSNGFPNLSLEVNNTAYADNSASMLSFFTRNLTTAGNQWNWMGATSGTGDGGDFIIGGNQLIANTNTVLQVTRRRRYSSLGLRPWQRRNNRRSLFFRCAVKRRCAKI